MNKWLKKLEVVVDKFIPYLIILLLFVIIIDLFFHEIAELYKFEIGFLDGFIVLVFVIDLAFKYNKVRNIPSFIRKYWLEILAVFPFYLVFRALELTLGFLEVSGLIKQSQNILHSGVEIEKEIALVTKEAREIEEIGSRTGRIARTFRSISRTPRLVAAASFYEEPKILRKSLTKTRKEIRRASAITKTEIRHVKKEVRKELNNIFSKAKK